MLQASCKYTGGWTAIPCESYEGSAEIFQSDIDTGIADGQQMI